MSSFLLEFHTSQMSLHTAISLTNSSPHLHRLSSRSSSPFPSFSLGFGMSCEHQISGRRRSSETHGLIRYSFSKVHCHGNVQYDHRPQLKWLTLYDRIASMDNSSVDSAIVLEQWECEEKNLSKSDLLRIIKRLRKVGKFNRALEVSDWMKSHGDQFTFNSSENAIQLDLIAKVHGIPPAEEYFSLLSPMSRDRCTYGALLNTYCHAMIREKAETTFEAMKLKGFAKNPLPFNVMMTLYMKIKEHGKVNAMIKEMKGMDMPLDLYSYNIWISNHASVGNTNEMETVVQELSGDTRLNANCATYTTLATMYVRLGELKKAQNCLKEAELRITGIRDKIVFHNILGLYSCIGDRDEVSRIWKRYKSTYNDISNSGYQAMLSSLVKLGDMKGAEKIYEEWLSAASKFDTRICNIVMRGYVGKGNVVSAKKAFDRFVERGGLPKTLSWGILAECYLKERHISEVSRCMESAAAAYRGVGNWEPESAFVAEILAVCREKDGEESVRVLMDLLGKTGCLKREEFKASFSE